MKARPKKLKTLLIWSLVALLLTLVGFSHFLIFAETRLGILLPNPLLALITPQDLTWPIFILIYSTLFAGLTILTQAPKQLLIAIQAYIILTGFRVMAIYLVPLASPQGIIFLKDPLVETLGNCGTLTKDLFFSGHTSLLFLLSLSMVGKIRYLFFLATMLVALFLLWQHAHYSVDIFSAPFFSYGAYKISQYFNRNLKIE